MQYVVKNKLGYYKFFRKIPNTNRQFIFSLHTKNYKVASKITTSFLLKSNLYFLYVKNLTKERAMSKIEEIKAVLATYRDEALEEYSDLETSRQKHFSHNGVDGSAPEAVEHWIGELQQHIINAKTEKQTQELVRQILKRSTMPLKQYYQQLDNNDKIVFMQMLIKVEASILKVDFQRAKEYFDLDHHLEHDKEQRLTNLIVETVNAKIALHSEQSNDELTYSDKQKFRNQRKEELYQEFLEENQHRKNEMDKIKSAIKTLLLSSKEEYIIDYEKADYDVLFFSLLYTPSGISQKKKIFQAYEGNYVAIAEDFKNDDIDTQGYTLEPQNISTLEQKLIFISNFLKFCIKKKCLVNNIFQEDDAYNAKHYKEFAKAKQLRMPYESYELEKMFQIMIEKEFFKEHIEEFFIPMIALFSGMRIEEIAQLRRCDIVCENKIYYFNINRNVKTVDSVRKVPLHSFLIDKLKFLDYIELKRENDHLFKLDSMLFNGREKYSHYYVMDFVKFRNQFVTEPRICTDLISFHSFRHTFSSRLANADVSDSFISALLGHKLEKGNETPRYILASLRSLGKLKEKIEMLDIKDIKPTLHKLALEFGKKIRFK